MINDKLIKQFYEEGATVIPKVLQAAELDVLMTELENAISEDKKQRPTAFDSGMVHNCMFRGEAMATLLGQPIMHCYLEKLLSPTCILYAYQSSSLPPGTGNYGTRIHVDSPRFIDGYMTNLGVIFPLNDFTVENGATYYLKGSHLSEKIPTEEEFYTKSSRIVCSAGDMILFNARLFHSAGVNHTNETRHSLTLNLCHSYMRQRFDFPRMITEKKLKNYGEKAQRLLGMNVRMPTSLDEFYLPESKRLYKPNQG